MNKIYKYYCPKCKKLKKKSQENFMYFDLSDHPNEHRNKINEIPQILLSKYEFVYYLNNGGFGHVFKVNKINDPNTFYALKIIKNDENFKTEIEILKSVSHHPNIIKYIDGGEIGGIEKKKFVVTELAEEDLESYCKKNLSNEQIYDLLLELAEGLFYLIYDTNGKNHILHLDLKLTNILIKDNHVK